MQPFFSTAPTLETDRLRLRALRQDDFDGYAEMMADPVTTLFMGGAVARGAAWRKFLFHSGHWALLGFGWWGVADKATDQFLGTVGLADFRRDMEPRWPDGMPEIGWTFLKRAQGKGFAVEACKRTLEWQDQIMRFARVGCIIDPTNVPSLKLAAKLGFIEIGPGILRDKPTTRLERRFPTSP